MSGDTTSELQKNNFSCLIMYATNPHPPLSIFLAIHKVDADDNSSKTFQFDHSYWSFTDVSYFLVLS